MIPVTAALVCIFAMTQVASKHDRYERQYGPVVGINLLHRHGDRTIDKQLDKDPYRSLKYWPEGIGELTEAGITKHYRQGQWLAYEYRHLVPYNFLDIHKAIRVVSTDWNRTIMSAEAELAGMFIIEKDKDRWMGMKSYVVPVHSIPEHEDALLEVTKHCPRLTALKKKNIRSKRYQHIMRKYRRVAKIIERNLGRNAKIKDLDDFQQIYSILSIETDRGLSLGRWAKAIYPHPLKEIATTSFTAPTWTRALKRLRGGPFIKELINNIQRKADDPKFPSVMIYSAHDTTISAVLNSMNGMFEEEKLPPPPFAALVIVEHRKKGRRNYVRVASLLGYSLLQNGHTTHVGCAGNFHLRDLLHFFSLTQFLYRCPFSKDTDCGLTPRVLRLPGCGTFCPLEKMTELLSDVTPRAWEAECYRRE